jgi:prolyl-tRNA editing enzyme YbaK/EbsC (Cys-tRNA(Pro) deacylase)
MTLPTLVLPDREHQRLVLVVEAEQRVDLPFLGQVAARRRQPLAEARVEVEALEAELGQRGLRRRRSREEQGEEDE